jgi:ubiquinone/menaquinone biosynthesis C-methylase UbiE
MEVRQAIHLIEGALPRQGGIWADLGCGDGTFTLALADLLGTAARIYAADSDPRALARLRRRAANRAGVIPVLGDFTQPLALPGYDGALDGLLFANALHFVARPERVLAGWVARLTPGGRVVVVEYDRRAANPWVPHPISPTRLEEVAAASGLSPPEVTARQPSAFSGDLYAAVAIRPAGAP